MQGLGSEPLYFEGARVLAPAATAAREHTGLDPSERRARAEQLAARSPGRLERAHVHGAFGALCRAVGFDADRDIVP